jgi:excisionase family DNA binding protein
MKNSADSRRGHLLRRNSLSPAPVVVDVPRGPLGRLAHLLCMNETMRTIPGLEPVLTTSELAAHLGVSVQTIHDLRHVGRGPRGFRVGRELRYRLSEVQEWFAQLEAASESQLAHGTAAGLR